MAVEEIKQFFELSTIHGLHYISNTRKCSRLFWTLVVIGGFLGAGYLIYESFHNWQQSPISTTVETLPISKILVPNVTVCPPKNLILNLNYDILESEEVKFGNREREILFESSLKIIQDHYYKEIMQNLSKLSSSDRYHNWYHGYTQINCPFYDSFTNQLYYNVETSATSGNLSTQYFGEMFDAFKVDSHINMLIRVYVPSSGRYDKNIKQVFDINKRSMTEVSGYDKIEFDYKTIDANLTSWSKSINGPLYSSSNTIAHDREVSRDDIRNMKLDMMPGFRLTWNYNNVKLMPEPKYSNENKTKQFVRYNFHSC